jgi:hypothetical protein
MFENTNIFPALQLNQLAQPIQFVESWCKYYPNVWLIKLGIKLR